MSEYLTPEEVEQTLKAMGESEDLQPFYPGG